MPDMTLSQVAALVAGTLDGDGTALISGVESLDRARKQHVSFYVEGPRKPKFEASRAACVIVKPGTPKPAKVAALITVPDPDHAFTQLCEHMLPRAKRPSPGVHATAVVASSATVGEGAHIGPYAVIGEDVKIGARCVIHPHCVIMEGSEVGDDTVFYPHCVVREFTKIGARCLFQAGAFIGSDGFGYRLRDGELKQVPQLGTVEISDDVHVGSASAVDRARFGKTRIGKGTKIDNLVQIGHNVQIGNSCGIAAVSGIGGSSEIGDFCNFGGHTGVANDLVIGAGAKLVAKAGADRDVPAGATMYWCPLLEGREAFRIFASLNRLPEALKAIKRLEKATGVSSTEGNSSSNDRKG